jgi:hypothetical protein
MKRADSRVSPDFIDGVTSRFHSSSPKKAKEKRTEKRISREKTLLGPRERCISGQIDLPR